MFVSCNQPRNFYTDEIVGDEMGNQRMEEMIDIPWFEFEIRLERASVN